MIRSYLRVIVAPIAIIVLITLLSACGSGSTSSISNAAKRDQAEKLQLLNESAESMYNLAKEGKVVQARERLTDISDTMTKIVYNGVVTPEGLAALADVLAETRRVYNEVSLSGQQAMLSAAKLRLAINALNHREKPLWLGYYSLFKEDAKLLASAIHDKNEVAATGSLARFRSHYLFIRPAVLISRQPQLVEKLDSWFIFMNGLISKRPIDYKKAYSGATFTDELLAELFEGKDAAAFGGIAGASRSAVWALTLLGAIVAVLTYVGWKKYKYSAW